MSRRYCLFLRALLQRSRLLIQWSIFLIEVIIACLSLMWEKPRIVSDEIICVPLRLPAHHQSYFSHILDKFVLYVHKVRSTVRKIVTFYFFVCNLPLLDRLDGEKSWLGPVLDGSWEEKYMRKEKKKSWTLCTKKNKSHSIANITTMFINCSNRMPRWVMR